MKQHRRVELAAPGQRALGALIHTARWGASPVRREEARQVLRNVVRDLLQAVADAEEEERQRAAWHAQRRSP